MEAAVTVCGDFNTVFIEMLIWALGPNFEGIDTFLGPLVVCTCIVELIGYPPAVVGRRPGCDAARLRPRVNICIALLGTPETVNRLMLGTEAEI